MSMRTIYRCLGVLTALMVCNVARADIFRLSDGGEVTGQLIERGNEGQYIVDTQLGARITLGEKQVKEVVRQSPEQSEYESRSRALPNTVAAHRSMAAWCKERGLAELADHHLRCILDLDPQDEQARTGLGFQRHRGKWLTRDEVMAARGLRFYDGAYRTEQDIALRERDKLIANAETEWIRQLKLWRRWLDTRRADEAHANLLTVTDPTAAGSVIKMLESERDEEVRLLWIDLLGQIRHPASMRALIDLSIVEPSRDVRIRCIEHLLAMDEAIDIQPYVKALRSKNNQTVNVAAEALGRIGNTEAISPLIDALVTTHKFQVGGGGGIGAAFSRDGSGGGGLSAGGPVIVEEDLENAEVRRALVILSKSQDFGFNKTAWNRWHVNQKQQRQPLIDTRRDQ